MEGINLTLIGGAVFLVYRAYERYEQGKARPRKIRALSIR